jgi:hypothetical protein
VRKKLADWWDRNPIIVPRWLLTVKYLGFVILGILTLIGGIPSLQLFTFDGYTTFWAIAVITVGVGAAVGTFRGSWEGYEKWAVVILTGLLMTWSVAAIIRSVFEGDIERLAGSWAVFMLSMLPAARAIGLLRGARK